MNYFNVGYSKEKYNQEKGFFTDLCEVYYVGIFIQGRRIYFSDFQHIAERCVYFSNICKLESGERYDITYGDPILIKGAKYIGNGEIDLPRPHRSISVVIENEFHIFEKNEMKIYVHPKASVNINPHKE